MQANGALEQKLAAWVKAQEAMAQAVAQAPVSAVNMGGSGDAGRAADINTLMSVMAAQSAKSLALDMQIK